MSLEPVNTQGHAAVNEAGIVGSSQGFSRIEGKNFYRDKNKIYVSPANKKRLKELGYDSVQEAQEYIKKYIIPRLDSNSEAAKAYQKDNTQFITECLNNTRRINTGKLRRVEKISSIQKKQTA